MTMHRKIDQARQERKAEPVRATRAQFMAQDDKAMLRAARDLTKGLGEAKPGIYWPDMLISVHRGGPIGENAPNLAFRALTSRAG